MLPVFDLELQMRLWRSVGDAMIHGSQAALAAASAWQEKSLASGSSGQAPVPQSFPGTAFAMWPWANASAPAPLAPANPFLAMMPWMQTFSGQSPSAWPMAGSVWNPWQAVAPPAAFTPFWPFPVMTWAYMQTPLTMMMMSAGLPYDVASPSAKASTAVMDAADAARQQMENVFSAYRSEGGHAAVRS